LADTIMGLDVWRVLGAAMRMPEGVVAVDVADGSRASLVRTNRPAYGAQSGYWRHPRCLFGSHTGL
jgi:hypothetical protein